MPRPPHKSLTPLTIERVNWLIDRLRKSPHRYDQGRFCGVQGCLAGFIFPKVLGAKFVAFKDYDQFYHWLMKKLEINIETAKEVNEFTLAGDWLGISKRQAGKLFVGYWRGKAAKFNRSESDTDREAADKAIKRLELFISSDGLI